MVWHAYTHLHFKVTKLVLCLQVPSTHINSGSSQKTYYCLCTGTTLRVTLHYYNHSQTKPPALIITIHSKPILYRWEELTASAGMSETWHCKYIFVVSIKRYLNPETVIKHKCQQETGPTESQLIQYKIKKKGVRTIKNFYTIRTDRTPLYLNRNLRKVSSENNAV